MTTQEIISEYLSKIQQGIKDDAAAKNQKIPVSSFRIEATETQGKLYAAHYFQYLVTGRGPGKFPPPDVMEDYVKANPAMLEDARRIWKYINEKGLAFLIGRKIARYGTDIFTGRKQGIDLVGIVEGAREDFLQKVAYHQAVRVGEEIHDAVAA